MDSFDVSIVITSYNYAEYLPIALRSCLNQKISTLNYEVILVDDGSTDETHGLMERMAHPKLKKFKIQNIGIEGASNFGFSKSKGKYIVRVDADDVLNGDYLRSMEAYILSCAPFIYPNYSLINSDGVEIGSMQLPAFNRSEILSRGDFLATGTLVRRDLLFKHGLYSTNKKNCGLESYELIIKMVKSGLVGLHVDKTLFKYRRHRSNISDIKREEIIKYGDELFSELGLNKFSTNEFHPYGLKVN